LTAVGRDCHFISLLLRVDNQSNAIRHIHEGQLTE
jgi:hypothetical protein